MALSRRDRESPANAADLLHTGLAERLQHLHRMGRYEVLETVAIADCALEIAADDLDDLFATAARALAEVMVDPDTLAPSIQRHGELEAPSLDLLLFDWLWLMREQRLGALPVVRAGRLVGILTERDVLRAFEEVLSTDALTRPYRWAFAYR